MGIFEGTLAEFDPEKRERLLRATEAYLQNSGNRGQFDRAQGYDPEELQQRAATLLGSYVGDQERKWRELVPRIASSLRRPPARILDAGSSIGQSALVLSCLYPEASVTGCEIELAAVDIARILTSGRPACQFLNRGIEEMPAGGPGFDLIHCANVIEHVSDPERVTRHMARLLAPGGILLLSGPNYLFPWEHHAHCWILPGGGRRWVKWVVKRRGEDPAFVDHLRLEVNTVRVKRWLRDSGLEWQDLSLDKISKVLLGPGNGLAAPALVGFLKRTHLNRIAARILTRIPLAPSLTLLAKRTG